MSNEMGAAVREVAKYFPTAVISGRSRDEVKGFVQLSVQLSNAYYAGSHGMDIMLPPKPLKPCDSKSHTTASALDKKINIVRGNSQKDRGCKSRGQQILHLCTLPEGPGREISSSTRSSQIFSNKWEEQRQGYGYSRPKS